MCNRVLKAVAYSTNGVDEHRNFEDFLTLPVFLHTGNGDVPKVEYLSGMSGHETTSMSKIYSLSYTAEFRHFSLQDHTVF